MTQILKTVLAGVLAGFALFMLPFFLLKVLVFFLLIAAAVRLLGGRRHRWAYGMHPAFAYKFQQMNEEEKNEFMQKFNCGKQGRWEYPKNDKSETDESKNI